MKLGKTSWLIIISSVVIVAFASLGMAHSSLVDELEQLDEELALAEMRLDKGQLQEVKTRKSELEQQLDLAEEEQHSAREEISVSNESIYVTDALFVIAQSCNVTINDIRSSDLSPEELAGVSCSAIQLSITAGGKVADLINFVTRLNTDFTTGIVNSADINIPGQETETEPVTVMLSGEGADEAAEEEEEEEEEGEGGEEAEEEPAEEEPAEEEIAETTGGPKSPSASIRLTVYSYQGD